MSDDQFDVLADAYDAMIDWEKRLAREGEFFRGLFDQLGVRTVLDAACGTGRHAAMFASWGLQVQGADLSAAMIDHCRKLHAGVQGLEFVQRSFLDAPPIEFDAVVCLGNSLALLPSMTQVQEAMAGMLAGVRSGGALVVQVVNLLSREEGPVRWDKCLRTALPNCRDALILKGTHRASGRGYVDFALVDLSDPTLKLQTQSPSFLELHALELSRIAKGCGCRSVETYGGYDRRPFDAASSADLICLCHK